MNESRRLLQHFLAALAYRTQKALRGAPEGFGDFRAAPTSRTPYELLWHMTGLMGYARTMLHGGEFEPPRLPGLTEEIARFHATLEALHRDFGDGALTARISDEQFLQGPLADAMTHAGQLAFLRRLFGSPVPSENFIFATIDSGNVGAQQAQPNAPIPTGARMKCRPRPARAGGTAMHRQPGRHEAKTKSHAPRSRFPAARHPALGLRNRELATAGTYRRRAEGQVWILPLRLVPKGSTREAGGRAPPRRHGQLRS